MAAAPPPSFPPTLAPPPVPEGWRADWSPEYNTWFYINLATQQSQWINPLGQPALPLSPPEYGSGPSPGAPQYFPGPQPDNIIPQQPGPGQVDTPPPDGPDGERGLGKVGGGLLGVAGGLLAGAFMSHEIDEHKNKFHKPGFKFWNNDNNSSGGGLLSGLGRGGAVGGMFSSFAGSSGPSGPPPAQAGAGGGFFSSMSNNMPFAGASGGPPLHIHGAAYADRDITQACRRLITGGTTLTLDTEHEGLISVFGDPWPDHTKTISILYSYGQRPWEMITSADRCGDLTIIPHQPLDTERMAFIKGDGRSRVIAVTWGKGNGLEQGKGTVEKLTQIETTGEFPATNDWMGFDGFCGPSKTAIVYYRTHNGIAIATARENGTVRLPWNPLARWT